MIRILPSNNESVTIKKTKKMNKSNLKYPKPE
jgi:hypothetical protein